MMRASNFAHHCRKIEDVSFSIMRVEMLREIKGLSIGEGGSVWEEVRDVDVVGENNSNERDRLLLKACKLSCQNDIVK